MKQKRRIPIVAAVLTLIVPGLGRLYNANASRALFIYLLAYIPLFILMYTPFAFTIYGLGVIYIVMISYYIIIIIDSFIGSKHTGKVQLRIYNNGIVYMLIMLAHAFVVIPGMKSVMLSGRLRPYRVQSTSMFPALLDGDRLMADQTAYVKTAPQRGDVVTFVPPGNAEVIYVARIIALPGELVHVRDKSLFINGNTVKDSWALYDGPGQPSIRVEKLNTFGPVTVPHGAYFILGDNRDNSYDSRLFGFVETSSIKAKALYLFWSHDKRRVGLNVK